jgi:hypothetical protein
MEIVVASCVSFYLLLPLKNFKQKNVNGWKYGGRENGKENYEKK